MSAAHPSSRAHAQDRSAHQARSQAHAPRWQPAPTDERALQRCLNTTAELKAGEWLWTTREGAERDLVEELLRHKPQMLQPRRLGAALVASARSPSDAQGRLAVTFARQGFPVACVARGAQVSQLAAAVSDALAETIGSAQRFALQVFVPDSAGGNPLATRAEQLERALILPDQATRLSDAELRRSEGLLVQVCLLAEDLAAVGGIASDRALSLWPGGRARMKLAGDFPSRAARKLAEAFAWLGMSPSGGDVCVDLGAAPGGWSWLLLEHKARVIAVDPARMQPKLMANPRLRHMQASAFEFTPPEPVDWLFCDMAWRPLEVAQMLARWARQRHARVLVANFKLPMRRKIEMVERLYAVLGAGGWTGIRTRQLYHDREEITLAAHVG